MTVNKPAADLLGVEVGDRLDVVSFSQAQVAGNEFRPGSPLKGPSFEVTVVGIVESPTDLEDWTASIYFSDAALRPIPISAGSRRSSRCGASRERRRNRC
jgi:hypothetical protein